MYNEINWMDVNVSLHCMCLSYVQIYVEVYDLLYASPNKEGYFLIEF